VRPHLKNCASCRAFVRELHSGTARVAALIPVAAVAAPHASPLHDVAPGVLARAYEALTTGVHERAVMSAQKLQASFEAAATGKVAAVAASAAALAGGGAAVVQDAVDRPPHPAHPAAHAAQARASADPPAEQPAATEPVAAVAPAAAAPEPAAQEQPPPPPASKPQEEMGFEERASAGTPAPASAPAATAAPRSTAAPASSGGGEFGP
jgi:hypothetical protein